MKKTVIVVIFLIYIASIAIVNFFGLEISIFEGTNYVTHIDVTIRDREGEILPVSKVLDDGTIVYKITFDGGEDAVKSYAPDDLLNPNLFIITPHAYPDNANNTQVKVVYDEQSLAGRAQIVDDGLQPQLWILVNLGQFTLDIHSTDGSNVSTKVQIQVWPK